MIAHPFDKAKELLTFYRQFNHTEPDACTTYAALVSSLEGSPIAALISCYNGPIAEGQRVLQPVKRFGSPIMDQIGPLPYTAVQQMLDTDYQPGLQYYWKSSFLNELSDNAFDTMITHITNRPTPFCHVAIEELGGKVSQIDTATTAFNHRDKRYSLLIVGMCPEPAEPEVIRTWAENFWQAMQPFTSDGVYVNYLGHENDEGTKRIKAAYGPEKYKQLVALKDKYDPTNLFRLNQNIRPVV